MTTETGAAAVVYSEAHAEGAKKCPLLSSVVQTHLQCIQLPVESAELAAHGVCGQVGLLHGQHAGQR